jgi:hypothetical protein
VQSQAYSQLIKKLTTPIWDRRHTIDITPWLNISPSIARFWVHFATNSIFFQVPADNSDFFSVAPRLQYVINLSAVTRYTTVKRLLAQILIKALEDLNRPKQRKSAEAFFASEDLDWIADALGLNPGRIRRRVAEGGVDPKLLRGARRANKAMGGGAITERARAIAA